MALKWYKLEGYKPYWTNSSTSLPENHIESLITPTNNSNRIAMVNDVKWIEYPPHRNIQWHFPMNSAVLLTKDKNIPNYLKATDGENNFYFYFNALNKTNALVNGEFEYECLFELDTYMTIYHKKLQILKDKNVGVNFLRKFTDRMDFTLDDEGKVKTAKLNLYKQKQFGNSLPSNPQMVRNFLYSTNELKLWYNNFPYTPRSSEISITRWNDTSTIKRSFTNYATANANGRYQYIVCKSSALQTSKLTGDVSDVKTFAKDTKLIIPIPNTDKENTYKALLNFDIKIEQQHLLNALSQGNVIGVFECDIPFTLLYGLSITEPTNCQLRYATNKIDANTDIDIPFFEMPNNYAPKFTLINFDEYQEGFDGRLKYLIENLQYNWDEKTEPTLINSVNYQERCSIDNDKTISSDLSLLNYEIDVKELSNIGLNLKAHVLFDNALHIAYDYENFNNQLNPLWNNKNSNLRNDCSIQVGVFGSAQANYYESNANTSLTSIANRKSEEIQDWTDYGFNVVKGALDVGSQPILGWLTGENYIKGIKAGVNAVQGAVDTTMSNQRANRSLSSSIRNIASSPATTITNPFIDSGIPNKFLGDGTLFQTFSNELHPWDKRRQFIELASNGYPINNIEQIKTYDNRQYMNVIHVDTSFNQDELISVLLDNDNSLFRGINYQYDMLTFLGTLHRFYKTDYLINCTDPYTDTYVPNIENILPPYPDKKIDIKTIIKNTSLGELFDNDKSLLNLNIAKNNVIPEDLKDLLFIDSITTTSCVINVKPNDKYFGFVICNFSTDTNNKLWVDVNGTIYKSNIDKDVDAFRGFSNTIIFSFGSFNTDQIKNVYVKNYNNTCYLSGKTDNVFITLDIFYLKAKNDIYIKRTIIENFIFNSTNSNGYYIETNKIKNLEINGTCINFRDGSLYGDGKTIINNVNLNLDVNQKYQLFFNRLEKDLLSINFNDLKASVYGLYTDSFTTKISGTTKIYGTDVDNILLKFPPINDTTNNIYRNLIKG